MAIIANTVQIAILAAGCFWGVEAYFQRVDGVIKAESGYTGGSTDDPGYREVCSGLTGHAEAVRVEFDSSLISYDEILQHFWRLHDPTQLNRQGNDVGTQYRSAIFYMNDEQKAIAEASIEALEDSGEYAAPIVTELVEAGEFYPAEDYHQDYLEKNPGGYCHIDLSLAEEPLD